MRLESRGATFLLYLAPKSHFLGMDAVIMLKHAAVPYARHGLVRGNPNLLPLKVFGLLDARVFAHENVHVQKAPAHEDRKAYPALVALGDRHDEPRHRHLRNVKVAIH